MHACLNAVAMSLAEPDIGSALYRKGRSISNRCPSTLTQRLGGSEPALVCETRSLLESRIAGASGVILWTSGESSICQGDTMAFSHITRRCNCRNLGIEDCGVIAQAGVGRNQSLPEAPSVSIICAAFQDH